jgi:hypothetical protein
MKEDLLKLIEKIQRATGMNQGEISEAAGYKSNYLSEQIAKNQVSKKLLRNVEEVLNKKSIPVKDAGGALLENQIEIIATGRVVLSVLAELQAPGLKRLPTELTSIYRRMVRDEAVQVRDELRQR